MINLQTNIFFDIISNNSHTHIYTLLNIRKVSIQFSFLYDYICHIYKNHIHC
jgi:hypothetical protein